VTPIQLFKRAEALVTSIPTAVMRTVCEMDDAQTAAWSSLIDLDCRPLEPS
jgi:hypothetical protein